MDLGASSHVAEPLDHEVQPTPRFLPDPPAFSDIERSVIQLSRKDPPASISDLQGFRVGFARLFATYRTNPLANVRLEELRRFAILTRIHGDPGDDALDRFLDAGFTVEQAELVRQILLGGLPNGPSATFNLMYRATLLLIAVGIYVLMRRAVADVEISVITAGLGLVTIASLTTTHRRGRYSG